MTGTLPALMQALSAPMNALSSAVPVRVRLTVLALFAALAPPVFWLFRLLVYSLPRLLAASLRRVRVRSRARSRPTRVVVLGGGFGGSTAAQVLHAHKDVHVTLIDAKSFFEHTPSVLRVAVAPSHASAIRVPHAAYLPQATVVTAPIIKADLETRTVHVGSHAIPFDYLVVATGVAYEAPAALAHAPQLYVAHSSEAMLASHSALQRAQSALIIGGGITGVELAAELCVAYPSLRLTLVHSQAELLTALVQRKVAGGNGAVAASRYAEQFLVAHGVRIVYDRFVTDFDTDKKQWRLTDGETVQADVAYFCASTRRALVSYLTPPPALEAGCLAVDGHFVLNGSVYAVGDVAYVPGEEKLAQNAEHHALVAVHNILASMDADGDAPTAMASYAPKERMIVISLGPYDGVFLWGPVCLYGFLPALLKEAVQWKTLCRYWSHTADPPLHSEGNEDKEHVN